MIIYAKSCEEESTFEVTLKCFLGEAVSMISSQCKMQFCQAVIEYVLPDLWEVTRMQGNYELPWVKIWFWLFIVVKCNDNEFTVSWAPNLMCGMGALLTCYQCILSLGCWRRFLHFCFQILYLCTMKQEHLLIFRIFLSGVHPLDHQKEFIFSIFVTIAHCLSSLYIQ